MKADYYEEFESVLNNISKRDICIIGGDMNAKTGLGHKEFPAVIGRYGKGEMNSSGRALAEMLMRNDMILGNTMFKHKMAHRTTWEGPQGKNPHKNKDGETRRNPYRNQIDYIRMRKSHKMFLSNAR